LKASKWLNDAFMAHKHSLGPIHRFLFSHASSWDLLGIWEKQKSSSPKTKMGCNDKLEDGTNTYKPNGWFGPMSLKVEGEGGGEDEEEGGRRKEGGKRKEEGNEVVCLAIKLSADAAMRGEG
jgi:hypothetical protein